MITDMFSDHTPRTMIIFGVGLMGASFAAALKKTGVPLHIIGVEQDQAARQYALDAGMIDEGYMADVSLLAQACARAHYIVLATPVGQMASIFSFIAPHLSAHTIVTDVGSTKGHVVAVAREILKDKIAQFVPAHPIAGRELNGPQAALATLFENKKLVITALPENTRDHVEAVAALWQQCGASIRYMTIEEHDRVFAVVSHLPHILAYTLVDKIAKRADHVLCFDYAASGFRDFTRIAGASPDMWRDICLANQTALLAALSQYQEALEEIKTALKKQDGEFLYACFHRAQAARSAWPLSSSSFVDKASK